MLAPATTRRDEPTRSDQGTPDEHGWLRRISGYCLRHRGAVTLAVGGAFLATLVTAAIPLVQRQIVDKVVGHHDVSLWPLIAVLLALAVVNFGAVFARRYLGGALALDVQYDLRTELFNAMSRLDGARQDEMSTGQLVSRSIADITMVQALLQMVPVTIGNTLLFVVSFVIMLVLSPTLTIVAFVAAPALLLIALASRRKLFPASWHASQQEADIAGIVDENVGGVRIVKGFGQEERELRRLEGAGALLYASRVRVVRLMARYNPALAAIPSLGLVGVLALGGWLAIHDSITLGTFLAFATYLTQLSGPVRTLTNLVTIGQEARASVVRVFDVIDSRPVIDAGEDAVALPADATGIELDHVMFGYLPDQPVLTDLSLTVAPGETLAVVGASGSGKSTIPLLLSRFYDVTGGTVRVGGHDVRAVTADSLRAAIGLVPEDSFLFSDTVRANIAFGAPDATDERVRAAARAARAQEFIVCLPDGYDTVIGEQGLTLSGGQRQRVALARALVTDPRVLVLDDATSAVDPRVEAEIHAALREIMADRTTLLIAHRRSTLHLADRIAVLDAGSIVDVGSHDELTARCPLYRLLITGPDDDAEDATGHLPDAGQATGTTVAFGGRGEDQPKAPGCTARGLGGGGGGVGGRSSFGRKRGGGRGGGGASTFHGLLGSVPPSQKLLAQVEALAPARDEPQVDGAQARFNDGQFTLAKLLRPFAVALLAGLALDGLNTLASLLLPALVKSGIDRGIEAKAFGTVGLVALAGLAIVLADWVVNIVQTQVVGRNGERLLYSLRVKIFAHLQRLGLDYYERELSGRIMTRMTTDVDNLDTFLQTGLITMVSSVLTFAGVLIALLVINLRLGAAVLTILPFLVVATLVFRAKSFDAHRESREKVSAVNADLQENVAGLRITQAYRREPVNRAHFAALSESYRVSRLRAQRYIALYFPFVQALSTIAGAVVLVLAAGEVRDGTLTAGALIAYLLYIDMVFSPIQQLSQVFDNFQQATVGLKRIGELLRLRTATPEPARPVPAGRLHGRIELRDARFGYQDSDRAAVDGVDLTIEPGETVALVGQTGAGKSTLVKLIARFYDVRSGAVLVDGVDVRDYDLTGYRQRLGVVPQEPYLFAGTVRDAIAYGAPDAGDADVWAAAEAVGAEAMIESLTGGYDHPVAERGRNLSAGQRQLLALARARLVDPDILLLDEATAALDLASEAAVNAATSRLTARRTTVVVAHRLSTAAAADRIVVLDGGQVVEVGSHDDLLAADGTYAALWDAFIGGSELVG